MPYIGNVLTSFAVETGNIADQAVTAPKLSATGGTNGQVLGLDAGGNLVWTSDPAGQWVTSGSDIYFDGGNVGIGTTSPASLLTVDGVGAFGAGSASAPSVSFNGDLNTGIYSPGADQVAISTNGTGRLEINSAGVISHKLYDRWEQNDGTSVAGYLGNANAVLASGNQADFGIRSQANIVFAAGGGTERMRLDSSGRLGLGTSSPDSKLHVVDANLNGIRIGYLSGSSNLNLYDADAHAFRGRGSGDVMRITSSGNVGIGTTSPSMPLEVDAASASGNDIVRFTGKNSGNIVIRNATADEVIIHTGTNDALVFGTNGNNERARIDSSGRLLVGTSTAFSSTRNAYESEATPTRVEYVATATNSVNNGFGVYNFSSSGYAPNLDLCASKSNTVGDHSVVSSDQAFGHINFGGSDGTQFRTGATILGAADGTPGSGDMPGKLVFSTTPDGSASPVERVRIRSGGTVDMFVDAGALNSRSSFAASASEYLYIGRHSATNTNTGTLSFAVYTNGNVVNTNNSYGAISDIKLKENIVDAGSQWDDLKALQVRKYNFKEGQTHTQIGLIAQEVELVSPGLVSESPDRDEEGNDLGTVTKSVNYSVLYMKAVKALQEAITRIETLEAEVQALKGA